MSSELKRTKRALEYVLSELSDVAHGVMYKERSVRINALNRVSGDVEQILNPPPEMIEVEETVGWMNVYPTSFWVALLHPTREAADSTATINRIGCQEIKISRMMEKPRPVERSAVMVMRNGVVKIHVSGDIPTTGKNVECLVTWTEDNKPA